jgi:hypothetical protein
MEAAGKRLKLGKDRSEINRSDHGFSLMRRINTDYPRISVASVKIRGELTISISSALIWSALRLQ